MTDAQIEGKKAMLEIEKMRTRKSVRKVWEEWQVHKSKAKKLIHEIMFMSRHAKEKTCKIFIASLCVRQKTDAWKKERHWIKSAWDYVDRILRMRETCRNMKVEESQKEK